MIEILSQFMQALVYKWS